MREIKFRVWKPSVKSLMELEDEYVSEGIYRSKNEEHILMQYTGLKDKNGKEIYEGDIYTEKERTLVAEIPSVYFDNYGDGLNQKEAEIIGNIYENPELTN